MVSLVLFKMSLKVFNENDFTNVVYDVVNNFEDNSKLSLSNFENNSKLSLSFFQKLGILAVNQGYNALVTAGTGSGKTLVAIYAIEHHVINNNRKVIYTSPIKALSNQKYHEFTKKFGSKTTIGILTGDVKLNVDANVLIMTCEILRNMLKRGTIGDDVACIIFDEVHYINDPDRGTVWEESIIMANRQLVCLSATIRDPLKFGAWISKVTNIDTWCTDAVVKRIVPLVHSALLFFNDSLYKDKEFKILVDNHNDPEYLLHNNTFNDDGYHKVSRILKYLKTNGIYPNKVFQINKTIEYLINTNKTPAIIFCLSRNGILEYTDNVSVNLNDDSRNDINAICRGILTKIPNYHDFMDLSEYKYLLALLNKGIGYHHAGMPSIFRELVEILFEKGHIKILFATETFSVGLNMPTKTVVFDSFNKFDGNNFRLLRPHEYTQMAGRAGRRSIDTIGYVFHLCLLFKGGVPDLLEYKEILSGTSLDLVSQFKIDYNFVLNVLQTNDDSNCNNQQQIKKTLLKQEIDEHIKRLEADIEEIKMNVLQTEPPNYKEYVKLLFDSQRNGVSQSVRKNAKKLLESNEFKKCEGYHNQIIDVNTKLNTAYENLRFSKTYVDDLYNNIIKVLLENNFIENDDDNDNNRFKVTIKGKIASNIHEVYPLILTDVLLYVYDTDASNLAGILGLFCYQDSLEDDANNNNNNYSSFEYIKDVFRIYGEDAPLFNNFTIIKEWCDCNDNNQAISFLQRIPYVGTFTKSILKMNNLIQELISIEELDVKLRHTLSQIPNLVLKHVVTNQSLYI